MSLFCSRYLRSLNRLQATLRRRTLKAMFVLGRCSATLVSRGVNSVEQQGWRCPIINTFVLGLLRTVRNCAHAAKRRFPRGCHVLGTHGTGGNCCCERVGSLRVVYKLESLTALTTGTRFARTGAITSRFRIKNIFNAS